MRPSRDVVRFALWFTVLSILLGWIVWSSTLWELGISMLAVPVICAMLASQGFTWKRKLTYASTTVALYVLGVVLADAAGLISRATQELNTAVFPSVPIMIFMAYLSTFPFAMLVLFVGRAPSLLWSKRNG
jgi:hypothetical protein